VIFFIEFSFAFYFYLNKDQDENKGLNSTPNYTLVLAFDFAPL